MQCPFKIGFNRLATIYNLQESDRSCYNAVVSNCDRSNYNFDLNVTFSISDDDGDDGGQPELYLAGD